MRRPLMLVFLLGLLAIPKSLLAGPPFQLDDPDVIPYRHFEFYLWGGAGSSPGVVDTAGPAVEFNWSGVRNMMFHFILPAGADIPSGAPAHFGLEDGEVGWQYRFVQETKHRPMIGTFTMMEIPTGDSSQGLGAGGPSWKIPLYAQKSFGAWTIDGGGGEDVSNIAGARDYPFGGTIVTRDVSKKLTIGPEIFAHGRPTADPALSKYAVDLDFGGIYTFRLQDPGFQLMVAYGHSVAGENENYAYLALYWTWGPKSPPNNQAKLLPGG